MSEQRSTTKNLKSNQMLALLSSGLMMAALVGCNEKPAAKPAFEKTKTSAQEAGDAIAHAARKTGAAAKDAAKETGQVVGHAAEKTWDGIKQGAREVTKVATTVAGEVKTGAQSVGAKVKEAVK